jgi:hypothetical protein
VGQDKSWGDGIQKALDAIPNDEILHRWKIFLKHPLKTETVCSLLMQWRKEEERYLETSLKDSQGARKLDSSFRQFNADFLGAGINSAVYSKTLLRHIAGPGHFYTAEDQQTTMVLEEGVRGRFWKP